MKTRYFLPLMIVLLSTSSASAQTFFMAHLTSEQAGIEQPGAVGTAALVLTNEGLRYFVTIDGLSGDVTVAHFHRGEIGVSGSVIHPIQFEGNQASGVWSVEGSGALTDELMEELLTGQYYVNVHTSENQGGEIRGQVLPVSGTTFSAALTPDQEAHEVESDGTGTAVVQLMDAGAIYFATVTGLTGPINAAHFHLAEPGISGNVVHGISFDGNTTFGVWTPNDDQPLVDSLIVHLLLGNLYLNVHTGDFGAGELRGQLNVSGGWGFSGALNTENETQEVTSDGQGTGSFVLTEAGLIYRVSVSELTGPISMAHFHQAAEGEDGDVVRAIEFVDNTAVGIWRPSDSQPLTDELIQELIAGNIYVNVHTDDYPGGEIRSQVLLDEGTHLTAALTAPQALGDTDLTGTGTAAMTLTDEGLAYRVTVHDLSGDLLAAHFHLGALGVSGGVERTIVFEGNTAEGVWTSADDEALTDELLVNLLTGNLYINVHTPENQGGEIRGQVLVADGAGLVAFLTNEQETQEVTVEAGGTAALTLTEAGVVFRATVDGLSGDISAAHFHEAPAGVSGDVVRGITFENNTSSGVWRPSDGQALTDSLILGLMTGGLYLNVHTGDNPAGEIRGQIHVAGGVGQAVVLTPDFETGEIESEGQGTAALTMTGAGLTFDVTVNDLTGPVDAAHFHEAPVGEDGPVVRGITFEGNNASGFWSPTEDDQPLTPDLLQTFFAGDLYLNVHTEEYPGGEIRGQLHGTGDPVFTSIERVDGEIPAAFALRQNYPNPFNPETTISFDLHRAGHITLKVFNTLGQQVAILQDGPLSAGTYEVTFEASNLPSGLYFYRLEGVDRQQTRPMVLAK